MFDLSVYFLNNKNVQIHHLIACNDYFAKLLLLKRAISFKDENCIKNDRTLRDF